MRSVLVALLLALFSGVPVMAADISEIPGGEAVPYKVVMSHNSFEVNPDGTFIQHFDRILELRTQQGVQSITQTTVQFSESMDQSELEEVYTLKKDGRKIMATPEQIFLRAAPTANNAPMFNDFKVRIGIFPNAEVGDRVGFKGVLRRVKPLLPKQFFLINSFGRSELIDDLQISITAPESMHFNIEELQLDHATPVKEDGKLTWTWNFRNDRLEPADDNATVDGFDRSPRLVVSTIKDYASLAKLYQEGAAGKDRISPAIQELADSLTSGQSDRREQARLLYEWVANNIRYVAINLGTGAVIPHEAAIVLANRYGDCKDHVILLQALLAAKGIASSGALINTANHVSTSPVAALAFNHIITYLPEWDIYADSTARYTAFGSLPGNDYSRPVLLTSSGKMTRTPLFQADREGVTFRSHVVIGEDGDAEVDSDVVAEGGQAAQLRAQMAGLVRLDQEDAFIHRNFGNNASGKLKRDDWTALTPSYHYSAHYHFENYISIPGPGALYGLGLASGMTVANFFAAPLKERHYPYFCGSTRVAEDITVDLPPSLSILALPKDLQWQDELHQLAMRYEKLDDHRVHIVRSYRFQQLTATCALDYYNILRPQWVKLRGALRAAVIYQ